ncbi:hypothetical protein FS842_007007, partial [Serendipita sp. 407]
MHLFWKSILFSLSLVAIVHATTYDEHRYLPRQATDDPQTNLTLEDSQVQSHLASSGLNASDPNITPSLTSPNNFINFCLTQDVALTNGMQNANGSCNPTPV